MKVKFFKIKIILFFFCIISFTALTPSCSLDPDFADQAKNTQYSASDTVEFQLPLLSGNRIRLNAVSGSIEITGAADLDSVVIRAEKRVESESVSDAEIHLKKLSVQVERGEDFIQVKTVQPGETGGRNYLVHYLLQIPINWGMEIQQVNGTITVENVIHYAEINNTNGNIRMENINGNVGVNLTNGEITLVNIEGDIRAYNVNGLIYAQIIIPASGNCTLSTVNGNISLYIPDTTSARFLAQVVNGTITLSNLSLLNAQHTPTQVSGRLGSGDGELELHAVNGRIAVTGL